MDSINLPVRDRFRAAHEQAITAYGNPGSWLDSETRVNVLIETRRARDCMVCQQQKESLSPYLVPGEHSAATDLDQNILELVHRLTNDASRLTKNWFEKVIGSGISQEIYVEVVGMVATAIIVDGFSAALGLPRLSEPEPLAGKPAKKKNEKVVDVGAWVPILDLPADTTESGIPSVPNIFRSMGLVPEAVQHFFGVMSSHYSLTSFDISLDRSQVEYIASRMSSHNQCFY